MGRPSISERAMKYVLAMPPSIAKQHGHDAFFGAACALVKGFALSVDQARPILHAYNEKMCDPKWSERELEHKLTQADRVGDTQPRGYLAGAGNHVIGEAPAPAAPPPRKPPPKAEYDPALLKSFAGDLVGTIDLLWLANRSVEDPAKVTTDDFLRALYNVGEKIVVFTKEKTQGQALWPDEPLPATGPHGVWFLAQPVDGQSHHNPRTGNMSRRSEESVTSWRFLLLESDDAPLKEWLAVLVKLPLKISAIYSSGGRSVHALVKVDAKTKPHWDAIKEALAPGLRFLVMNGADTGVLSGVRLTRLPGTFREEKRRPQKLLYVNPAPRAIPLLDLFPRRDVEADWLKQAAYGISDADETGGKWLLDGLRYYARQSAPLREALIRLEAEVTKND